MRIEIVVFDGVDELDAFGPLEVLRNAERAGAGLETSIASVEGRSQVAGSHGVCFETDGLLGARGRSDLLIIPGGNWAKRSPQGAWAEAQRGLIPAAIAEAHRAGTLLASVCTGAMLIAAANLLKGRSAVTHHSAIEQLRQSGAYVVQARIVDDGDIITSGGVTSGIDLALYLVERFAGRNLADQVATGLEHERRGPLHISASSWRDAHGGVAQ
jgi:transcriptional regulator GlxA family with amidase domain